MLHPCSKTEIFLEHEEHADAVPPTHESLRKRLSNLNKEGLAANADLLAVKDGVTWQIQVKGSTFGDGDFWFGYGQATDGMIARTEPAFNRKTTKFYKAEIVVLVSVKSPREYRCLVLPVEVAERAAQINMDHGLRTLKKDGSPKKPGRFWVSLDYPTRPRTPDEKKGSTDAGGIEATEAIPGQLGFGRKAC